MVREWSVLDRRVIYEDRWIRLRSDTCVTARGKKIAPYHVLDFPDWVNVVALTNDCKIVLVRQYRHAAGEVLLGLPAGLVESTDENPQNAVLRELREETGLSASFIRPLDKVYPNPARQTNSVYSFFATQLSDTEPSGRNPAEELETITLDFATFIKRVLGGEISLQALHQTAVFQSIGFLMRSTNGAVHPARRYLQSAISEDWLA